MNDLSLETMASYFPNISIKESRSLDINLLKSLTSIIDRIHSHGWTAENVVLLKRHPYYKQIIGKKIYE